MNNIERRRPPLQPTLDEKINAALGNSRMAIDDLQQLLEEIEGGIREGAKQVRQEHDRSLDPSTAPVDRDQAAQRSASADLECRRLARALITLRARLAEILQQERRERWSARFERHAADCNALAKEFRDTYPSMAKQLVELLQRIAACDRESSAINGDAPDNEFRRLSRVELLARELEQFSSETPSIIQNVTLPDWTGSAFWPLPQTSMASAFAAVVPPHHSHRFSGDWWKENERRAAAQRVEQQRIADYYARTTKEQEDRENAEARERFLEQQQRLTVDRPPRP